MTHEEIVEDHVNYIMHDAESYVADYSNKEWFKARLTSALTTYRAQVLEEVVEKMQMEGLEHKFTPFQQTVNTYIRNRGEEIAKEHPTN